MNPIPAPYHLLFWPAAFLVAILLAELVAHFCIWRKM